MGVFALNRAVVVSTFRTVYSARLQENVFCRQAEYTVRNVEITLALFRAKTLTREILQKKFCLFIFSSYLSTPCKAWLLMSACTSFALQVSFCPVWAWHDLGNTEYHCWPITNPNANNFLENCQGKAYFCYYYNWFPVITGFQWLLISSGYWLPMITVTRSWRLLVSSIFFTIFVFIFFPQIFPSLQLKHVTLSRCVLW